MTKPKVDFLYLDEKDMIEAGVLDMHECINTMEEVYHLLGTGDYVMGGRNHNSHGILIEFPKEPEFPSMPKDGPDRRFMAMPAYLGGNFRVCGNKWYGSNIENIPKGLPRSVLMMFLNDADTGAPLALQSANLLSGMRTGAIPGVGVRYLAKPNSKVLGIVGAGAINRLCFTAIEDACETLKTVKIYDLFEDASKNLKAFINEKYENLEVIIVDNLEDAIRECDIVNIATSGEDRPFIDEKWIKPGCLFSLPASIEFNLDFAINKTRKVVDNWKMYEAFEEELDYPYSRSMGLLGTHFLDWIHEGKMTKEQVDNLGDIIAGKIKGRESDDEIILFGMGGQPVYDVAWGYQIYQNALNKNIGVSLNLWEKAYQAR